MFSKLRRLLRCFLCCGVVGLGAAACSKPPEPASGAASSASSPTVPAGPDLERGELLSYACQACHALTPAGGANIGPSLYGIFGRTAAMVSDFEYSDALRAAGFVWTPAQLDLWLQEPTEFLPGTTMAFAGYGDAVDRAALIAWLEQATAPQ